MGRVNRIEIFQILGIEETKDEKRIRDAYRGRLSVTNPEDDPEGFKRLRSAYEEACRLAKEDDEVRDEPSRDITPSGLWVEKAADIYNNIHTRQDLKLWEKLFAEDCFLSLEDEENCRFKLLRFLMDHFKLPADVWKLLDKKLSIVSDAARLREQFPADFVRYILNKCERGEDVEFSQFEGPENGDYDLFLQYYDRTWQALAEGKLDEAAQDIENADGLGIRHPILEICRGNLMNRQGKSAEAVALMEALLEKYPKDVMVRFNTAELLWKQEADDNGCLRGKAARIYEELKEENDNHYMANVRLTEWYYEKGQYKKAKSCAEKVLSGGSDEAFMELLVKVNTEIEKELEKEYRETKRWEPALELCWCYLQDGKISRGIMLAVGIEKQLPPEKEAEFNGLMAKLYVEEAEYEDSIIMSCAWEESLRKKLEAEGSEEEKGKDRDRLKQAHLIRMQCCHNLGLKDREQLRKAVEEGDAVLAESPGDIGILLEQAQLFVEMEEYERCLELVNRLVEDHQIFAAHAVSLEAYRKQLDAAGVIRSGSQCIRYFPGFVKSYEYMAKVYLDLDYKEELERLLEEAEKNHVRSDILEACRYQLTHRTMELSVLNNKLQHFREKYRDRVEKGEMFLYPEGLQILTEYLYNYPDSYMFVERGLYHRAAHHYKEAKEDFEKAVALEPTNSYALNGLSLVYRYMGDYEKALVCIRKAILYMDENLLSTIYEDMGRLYSLLGDSRRALAAYMQSGQLSRGKKRSIRSMEELAECRLRAGHVDEADNIYRQIYGPDIWQSYIHRADLFSRSGNEQETREILAAWRKELGLDKDDPVSRYLRHMTNGGHKPFYSDYYLQAAWAELIFGSPKMAVRYFEEALACNSDSGKEHSLLADAVFGCIVCGDDRRGKKYGEKLRIWLNQESFQARDRFFNSARSKLYYRILGSFYTASSDTLQELLGQKDTTENCHFCTNPFCKELEGIYIIFLHRQGKSGEAQERLARNLEIFPQDEFMLAIRHTVFGE